MLGGASALGVWSSHGMHSIGEGSFAIVCETEAGGGGGEGVQPAS